jgi:L-ascorbate metabolism protein UlaG (beta-lactamase superfamily)
MSSMQRLLCLLGAFAACRAPAQMLDQIRSRTPAVAVWWTGNAGWLIRSGDLVIGIDLDLSTAQKVQPPPITAGDAANVVDVALVSHHHGDHCNVPTIRALAEGGKTTLVLPQTCVARVPGLNLPPERLIVPQPGRAFDVKGMHVEPIHAIHGNQEFTVLTREPDFLESMARNCGYVFTVGQLKFFHPGDSVLTEEHLGLKGIDVLFISPTVHNMYIDRSMILINRLRPAHIFPQHFGTFIETDDNSFWTHGYPDELRLRLSRDLQQRYHKLRQGEMFTIR